jgi:hypothetical protein
MAMFERHRARIVDSLEDGHSAYYRSEVFGGPSLYFHQKALEAAKSNDLYRFAEYVYAVLASWGMHRMGPGGSKMRDFAAFEASLGGVWPVIIRLREKNPAELRDRDWEGLKEAFIGLRCMASGTSLVGNSKVLAHALPRLVPPIDREYTIKFLFGHKNIKNGLDAEWLVFETILRNFFYPVLGSDRFPAVVAGWIEDLARFPWDTSPLKIIDNVLIGLAKMDRAVPEPQERLEADDRGGVMPARAND